MGQDGYSRFADSLVLNHHRLNLNLYGNYTCTERRYFTYYDFDRRYATT